MDPPGKTADRPAKLIGARPTFLAPHLAFALTEPTFGKKAQGLGMGASSAR